MKNKGKSREVKKNRLGRGLDALLDLSGDMMEEESGHLPYFLCPVADIRPNRYQPRRTFSEEELAELSQSIQEQGVLQPLLVREDKNGGYELVAGERRLRAARMAGLSSVPVVVRELTDQQVMFATLVENIQRENLNPLEAAEGYQRLMDEFGLTQEEIAQRVGKKRSTVANLLRLRTLPEKVQKLVADKVLSMGHARAICSLPEREDQESVAAKVAAKGLSVRETEALVKKLLEAPAQAEPPPPTPEQLHIRRLAEDLSRRLGTKVAIQRKGKKGTLSIEFYKDEDLNRIIELLLVRG
ncbi:MAG: ParB/RepB/Spo0J family partition protein [Deltaproteobacteria bacterium]|nr:ParB/RepB/Spo0J family partition protein [Deltaproteobacteria bacterium]